MAITDKAFTLAEKDILKSFIGKRLKCVDACIVARGDMAWNTVRLHFEGFSVDLNNTLEEIVVDEFGSLDEFGLMSVCYADSVVLDVPEVSADTTVIPVDEVVRAVKVVNSLISIYGDGELVATISYPQAVILDFAEESLVLDKETWFDETISIKAGPDAMSLVYDDSVNWEDDLEEDPSTHYEVKAEIMIL